MKKQDEIFDNKIKSLLEGAEDPVPDFVWEGVSAKLDATPSHKDLWWWTSRVLAPVTAAAAAVAVGVFAVTGQLDSNEGGMIEVLREDTAPTALVKESVPERHVTEEKSEKNTVTGKQDRKHEEKVADKKEEMAVEKSEAAPILVDAGETPECEIPEPQPKPESKPEPQPEHEPKKNTTLTFEDWAEFEEPVKNKKQKLLLSFAGNITGRESMNSKGMRPMKTSSSVAPYTSGLKEVGESTYGLPVTLGIGAKYEFTNRWTLGFGLNYTLLSRRLSGIYTDVSGEEVVRTNYKDIVNNQSYIGIETKLFFNAVNSRIIDFYVYAGGGVEKPFLNSFNMKGADGNRHYKGACEGVQPYLKAGLGLEFNVSGFLGIYLDPNVIYCFRNDRLPQSIRTVHNLFPGVEAGLRFRL